MEKELKPFARVLVRNFDSEAWTCDIFSHETYNYATHEQESACIGGRYYQCIPYEGNEDFLGSYDSPEEKRWRAKEGEYYFYLGLFGEVLNDPDERDGMDDLMYNFGNYFRTEEEAEAMSVKVKKLLNEH